MIGWSGITLPTGLSNGNLKQLYPTWCPTGVAKASATNGQQIRGPVEGILYSLQVKTDGVEGGTIEIWDIDGSEAGADVSSADTITNAQLVALQAAGAAKLIYSQNFVASPTTPFGTSHRTFQKGLAARYVGDGTCELNVVVQGGYRLTTKVG